MLIKPGNKKILHNLKLARKGVVGDPLPWPEFSLAQLWGSLRGWLSANTWALLGLVVCWAALAVWWVGRGREKDWIWNFGALGLLFVALCSWLLAYSATRALSSNFSIVLAKEIPVQVGPDVQSGRVSIIYEGWKVKRLDQIGGWIKVELPDGQEGWVQPENLEDL
ncbi:MAG: SH3 domain-containing protein [Saprospirales bacterium]|nr:SH3 domain-containing protein [Saprospirales bacterium]